MRLIDAVERYARNSGRHVVPQVARRHLWFWYMEAKRVLETRSLGLFASVQIEVNTDCNRRCGYCSNFVFQKKQEYIDKGLYRKIIDELASIGYRGRISPNLSSEPLLHPRLPELIACARRVEKARIVLYTDGDFLGRERFDELRQAGVDYFIITQHGEKAPRALEELLSSLTGDERRDVVYQTLDGFNLFNRGIPGLIQQERRVIPNPCFVADYGLTIMVNGDLAQCSNDVRGEHVFGNVREQSIMQIWNSPDYRAFRSEVRRGQFEHDVCKRCVFDVETDVSPLSSQPLSQQQGTLPLHPG